MLLLIPLLGLFACNPGGETSYSLFNAEGDSVIVEVGVSELLDPVSTELHSSTGEVIVGSAEVRPGGGPIGTAHEIVVVVDDEHQDLVDRVTVRTESGERGEDEYTLDRDSADEGYYKYTLVSVGDEGETRSDTFTFLLWDAVSDTGN